ncbi:MAG: DUF3592 domain-containing protein [Lentisphaeria bacterium]|nr:DUF3592 domain-containing protein [Lentisphaeria bacterium]NQZ70606.1 DUF3592 domain-containing protein [Lentisphaeria bacterium]
MSNEDDKVDMKQEQIKSDEGSVRSSIRFEPYSIIIQFFLVISLLSALLYFIPQALDDRATNDWTKTEAIVKSSEQISGDDYNWAKIEYEYTVNDKKYSSDQVTPFLNRYEGSKSLSVTNYVWKYPKGAKITAWYNPYNPEMAVLEPGLEMMSILPVVLFSFSSFVFLLLLWDAIKRHKLHKLIVSGDKTAVKKFVEKNKKIDVQFRSIFYLLEQNDDEILQLVLHFENRYKYRTLTNYFIYHEDQKNADRFHVYFDSIPESSMVKFLACSLKKGIRGLSTIVLVFFTIMILLGIYYSISSYAQLTAASEWPETTGEILSIQRIKDYESDYKYLKIKYEFSIKEKKYISDKKHAPGSGMSFLFNWKNDGEFEKRMVVASKQTVYYNPQNPNESYLVKANPREAFVLGFMVFTIFTFGIIYFYRTWRLFNKSKPGNVDHIN